MCTVVPYISASRRPTFNPILLSMNAKLTDTVDLPTPPLVVRVIGVAHVSMKPPSSRAGATSRVH